MGEGANGFRSSFELNVRSQGCASDSDGQIDGEETSGSRDSIMFEYGREEVWQIEV